MFFEMLILEELCVRIYVPVFLWQVYSSFGVISDNQGYRSEFLHFFNGIFFSVLHFFNGISATKLHFFNGINKQMQHFFDGMCAEWHCGVACLISLNVFCDPKNGRVFIENLAAKALKSF